MIRSFECLKCKNIMQYEYFSKKSRFVFTELECCSWFYGIDKLGKLKYISIALHDCLAASINVKMKIMNI